MKTKIGYFGRLTFRDLDAVKRSFDEDELSDFETKTDEILNNLVIVEQIDKDFAKAMFRRGYLAAHTRQLIEDDV